MIGSINSIITESQEVMELGKHVTKSADLSIQFATALSQDSHPTIRFVCMVFSALLPALKSMTSVFRIGDGLLSPVDSVKKSYKNVELDVVISMQNKVNIGCATSTYFYYPTTR